MAKKVKVVIDANMGDSGKGLATDYFASKSKDALVILTNGGSQRGHTVSLSNGTRHVFRHFGSGTFAGADTYYSEFFIVNPMNYALEYRQLHGKINTVFINARCLITTPFDMIANQIIEDSRGDARHGSCGVGIWETVLRNRQKEFAMNVDVMDDLFCSDVNHSALRKYLEFVRDEYFGNRLSNKGITPSPEWQAIIYNNELINNYIKDFELMLSTAYLTGNQPFWHETFIYENGQGLLLDSDMELKGYGKNTTPSHTGLKNPAELIHQIPDEKEVEVCYVSRSYMTRHGMGRFDTEWDKMKDNMYYIPDATNGTNHFQGELRYGVLDLQSMVERCCNDFNNNKNKDDNWKLSFMITHLNEYPFDLRRLDGFKVYSSDGMTRESVKERK